MMNKKRTKEIGRTKYLMFLPLAVLLMIISNIEAVARTTKQLATEVIEAVDTSMEPTPKAITHTNDSIPEDVIFEVVEVSPEFTDGGMDGLIKYLSKNLKYPVEAQKAGIQGRVVVKFVVDKDGSIIQPQIARGIDPALDKEAIRVISAMPKWKPGTQRGKAVKARFTVPVMFKLPEDAKGEPAYAPVNTQLEEIVAVAYKPSTPNAKVEGDVFEVVEHMPEFPGGVQGMMQYIARNLKYPTEAQKAGVQGKIIVEMIINKEGNITVPKVTRPVHPLLDAEAIRVIGSMPKWKPGTQKGQPVNVKYSVPIMFRLQ